MVAAPSRVRFVEPAAHPHADESVFEPGRSFQMLRAKAGRTFGWLFAP